MKKKIKPEWHQGHVARCPDCAGLLLQSDFYHAEKCSKCGKLWLTIIKKMEIKDLE